MRKGPRPLNAHIGMAMSHLAGHVADSVSSSESVPLELQNMLLGIHKYQMSSYAPPAMPLDEMWRSGQVSVRCIPEYDYGRSNPVLLLVPSLINKSHILDLMEGRSMLRYMASQNINAYLLDWGDVCADEGQQTLDDLIMTRLVPALRFLNEKHGAPVHALGYCMGGTILAGAAQHGRDLLRSLIFLAAPWDFHAGTNALLNRVKFWAPTVLPFIGEQTSLPQDWLQMLFASLDPSMAMNKFSRFLDMDDNAPDAHLFIAVEDWLNDGVDLPADVARVCVQEWFLQNTPASGQWRVHNQVVSPSGFDCPGLVIASSGDRLVEYETAAALAEEMPHAEIIDPGCGHIGMIAGSCAIDDVWNPVAQWIHRA